MLPGTWAAGDGGLPPVPRHIATSWLDRTSGYLGEKMPHRSSECRLGAEFSAFHSPNGHGLECG